MADSPPVGAQKRVLADCAYKRNRSVSLRGLEHRKVLEITGAARVPVLREPAHSGRHLNFRCGFRYLIREIDADAG